VAMRSSVSSFRYFLGVLRFLVASCVLFAACASTEAGSSSPEVEPALEEESDPSDDFLGTFSLDRVIHLKRTEGDTIDRELRVNKGQLSIRFEDAGVKVDLDEFPGDEIKLHFKDLEAPMKIVLPDGTYFFFRGDSFEVEGQTYELEQGSGMLSFYRDGLLLNG